MEVYSEYSQTFDLIKKKRGSFLCLSEQHLRLSVYSPALFFIG